MLGSGDRVPASRVWPAPGGDATTLDQVTAEGRSLLCFYPFDWSPG